MTNEGMSVSERERDAIKKVGRTNKGMSERERERERKRERCDKESWKDK